MVQCFYKVGNFKIVSTQVAMSDAKVNNTTTGTDDQKSNQGSKKLVVHRGTNGDLGRLRYTTNKGIVEDVVIWGGQSLNGGESGVSNLVLTNSEYLTRFIFLPERHKGGRMVRPYYCKNDRSKSNIFSKLNTIGYWGNMGTPNDVRWICPELTDLILFDQFIDGKDNIKDIEDETRKSAVLMAKIWVDNYGKRIRKECPKLERIIFALPDLTTSEKYITVLNLLPMMNKMDWIIFRLFEIVKKGKEDKKTCFISMLSNDTLDIILEFFDTPQWIEEWFCDSN